MGLPRSKYVREGQEGVYHCFSRCVRRAFLCGFDDRTHRDFSHRKTWVVERLRHLASAFAIDVCTYAIMANHYHIILRTRPDIVARWSDLEVATRWLTLFSRHRATSRTPAVPDQNAIRALADCPERIILLRHRLSSLSWFMAQINEFIARAANKEDKVKGRFWESRFKCQTLLDEAAIACCMVYVDLNPIRATLAETPEESEFTSIQERIRAWRKQTAPDSAAIQTLPSGPLYPYAPLTDNTGKIPGSSPIPLRDSAHSFNTWLCPIRTEAQRRGILEMSDAEYFDLVDKSGRMTRSDKPGAIDAALAPILLRIRANPNSWLDTVSHFGSKFHLAAGLVSNFPLLNAGMLGPDRWVSSFSSPAFPAFQLFSPAFLSNG